MMIQLQSQGHSRAILSCADAIQPAGREFAPIELTERKSPFDILINRLFCDPSNRPGQSGSVPYSGMMLEAKPQGSSRRRYYPESIPTSFIVVPEMQGAPVSSICDVWICGLQS